MMSTAAVVPRRLIRSVKPDRTGDSVLLRKFGSVASFLNPFVSAILTFCPFYLGISPSDAYLTYILKLRSAIAQL